MVRMACPRSLAGGPRRTEPSLSTADRIPHVSGEDEAESGAQENPSGGDEGGSVLGAGAPAEQELGPQTPEVTDPSDKLAITDPSDKLEDSLPDLEENMENMDSDTQSAFLACVALTNVAVFGISAGLLIGVGRTWNRLAIGLLVVGVIAGVRSYRRYRKWSDSREQETTGSTG
ncbi:MAG: hypothetical protein A07HR60_01704 [uncultured archaeon A07HR60]|nr:MAG: hypothetical protein A07HR60_01704 [uncultured archaeon A07HR60]